MVADGPLPQALPLLVVAAVAAVAIVGAGRAGSGDSRKREGSLALDPARRRVWRSVDGGGVDPVAGAGMEEEGEGPLPSDILVEARTTGGLVVGGEGEREGVAKRESLLWRREATRGEGGGRVTEVNPEERGEDGRSRLVGDRGELMRAAERGEGVCV